MGKAYPTKTGDIIAPCPVCGKQIPMEHYYGDIWELLFHNDQHGTPCNGTARRALLVKIPNKTEVL